MIILSELQLKEVVLVYNGERIGHVYDLEIDVINGMIEAIIVEQSMSGKFFPRREEVVFPWGQIITIGKDVILVDDRTEPESTTNKK